MNRNSYVLCCVVISLIGLGGCSGEPSGKQSQKAALVRHKIQGKAQIIAVESNATDLALSAGGPSVYLWEGERRYRLFLKTPFEVEGGKEYIAEGIYAQKMIDEIGDPDQGKNGYPLPASCRRVVKTAWPGLPLDVTDGHAQVLRARVNRYPARPVFLVTRIQPVTSKESTELKKVAVAESEQKEIPEVSVPAEKQQAFFIAGPTVQPAPLWAPEGGTVHCKVIIDKEGKISDLETGAQLCESVPWSQFRYQPPVQRGRQVKVRTEVAVRFEPRK